MTKDDRVDLRFEAWSEAARSGAFEDALAALREVVGQLEAGQLRLDDSVRCFEIGTELARKCEQLLDEAELRITRLDIDGLAEDELDEIESSDDE
jgi:exodeoxyribonuclease VII small subunit